MVSEITKMQEFNHPHVLSLIGVCLDTGPGVSIVMPFMTNGSLLDYLRKERSNIEQSEDDPDMVSSISHCMLIKTQILYSNNYSQHIYTTSRKYM